MKILKAEKKFSKRQFIIQLLCPHPLYNEHEHNTCSKLYSIL